MPFDATYTLGRTGLRVNRLALGAMTFGTAWGRGADRDTARSLFDDGGVLEWTEYFDPQTVIRDLGHPFGHTGEPTNTSQPLKETTHDREGALPRRGRDRTRRRPAQA